MNGKIIEIKGVKILTGHHYYEYTKEERELLPKPWKESAFMILDDSGAEWWYDTEDLDAPGFGEEWWENGIFDGKLKDFDYVTKEYKW